MPRDELPTTHTNSHRFAVISDVHGNLPAYEAATAYARRLGVDRIFHAGDLINGPCSREVLERTEADGIPGVLGNHEEYILYCEGPNANPALLSDSFEPARWTRGSLTSAQLDSVAQLPRTRSPHSDVTIVHGSLTDTRGAFRPGLTDAQTAAMYADIGSPVVICGHTHRQHARRVDGKLVVNMGSTGNPADGDPRARLLILEGGDGHWTWRVHRVPYDVERHVELARETGWLDLGGVAATMIHVAIDARPWSSKFVRWWNARKPQSNPVDAYREFARIVGIEPLI